MNRKTLEAELVQAITRGECPPIILKLPMTEYNLVRFVLVQKATGKKSISWPVVRANMGYDQSIKSDTLRKRYKRSLEKLCKYQTEQTQKSRAP